MPGWLTPPCSSGPIGQYVRLTTAAVVLVLEPVHRNVRPGCANDSGSGGWGGGRRERSNRCK